MKAAPRAAALIVLVWLTCTQSIAAAAEGPFSDLDGSWSGSGTIKTKDGSSERIRCRVGYQITEGGRLLSQDLRCASDSYKFELQTTVTNDGGKISGAWNETTRAVVGKIDGRMSGGDIEALATSPSFSANLSIATRGNQQSISIRSPGSEISEVAITLQRASR